MYKKNKFEASHEREAKNRECNEGIGETISEYRVKSRNYAESEVALTLSDSEQTKPAGDTLFCPVKRINDKGAKKALRSAVKRINSEDPRKPMATIERNIKTDLVSAVKKINTLMPQAVLMTKAHPKAIDVGDVLYYVESGNTFAHYEGEDILLFEGILRIEKRKLYVTENFANNGKTIDYDVEARFFLSLDVDGAVYFQEVTLEVFDSGNFINKMSGGESSLERFGPEKKLFAKYAKQLRRQKTFETQIVFETAGWKNYNTGDCWYYVTPAGIIGNPGENVMVENGKMFEVKSYWGASPVSDFLGMRAILANHPENAIVCQIYFILALLKSLLREAGLNPQFLLAIIGETMSKKTTLATLFFKLYERESGPDIDFTATKVALEEATASNADAVTIFDDITPPNTRAGELELKTKVEALTRTFGGNLPRKRSKLFTQLNKGVAEFTPVLGQGVVTGEVLPVTLKSSRARILKLEFKRSDCDDRVLTQYQNNLGIIPAFAVEFIDFVTKNQKNVIAEFKSVFASARVDDSLGIKTPRFRDAYAMLLATVHTFACFLRYTGEFSEDVILALVDNDTQAIARVVLANDHEAEQRPDEELISECILDRRYAQMVNTKPIEPLEQIMEEDGFLIVYPNTAVGLMKKHFSSVGKIYPFSSNSELYKFLEEKKLILVKHEGDTLRHTHKYKAADGGERRFFKFYIDEMQALLGR